MRRVAVTGLGAITPIGLDAPSTWEAAVAGESGIDFIQAFDATQFPVQIAGEVKGFDPSAVAPAKEARRMDRNVLVDSASGQIAISLGLRGPNYAPVSACATGSHAVGEGAELIRRGDADAVLAGGTEACIHPLILAGFCAMRGLVAEDEDPTKASRPFDATRAGFVMSEAACILLLEDLDSAQARGATIYAEVLGYGASNDAHHMAQPEPEATGVAAMMRAALERSGVEPERVGYINAHGTSTPLGDAAETRAIKQVFGDRARERGVASTKSVTGDCFGGAGAIEAMMCTLALHHQLLPPTINYVTPDPECDLDYVPNEAREAELDVALSNAMGLGGHNACVLVARAS